MHIVILHLFLVINLIHPLNAGILDASKRKEESNSKFVREGNGELKVRRRLQQTSNDEELLPVIIGVNDDSHGILENVISRLSTFARPRFKRINAISALISRSELFELKQNPTILYIEEDPMVYPDSNDVTLYGLRMVQAFAPIISKQNFTGIAACNDPKSFKIGIIDSGLEINHPDIPCLPRDHENTNCIGKEFGIDDGDGEWYNPIRKFHGTHVAGTIGASGQNNHGLEGIINDGNICFIIGRVFGESGGGTRMSNIFDAIEWVADQGAKVINLSLGVDMFHASGDSLMKAIYDEGALLVAASGNSGTNELHYPANYMNVLSVAAVDAKREHASFSQYNNGVDIAAPGVDVLSTQPTNSSGAIFLSTANLSVTGLYFDYSSQLQGSISGPVVLCPSFGSERCPGSGGHICLIKRGNFTFETKTLNCQRSGGIAAIVYNYEPGKIEGKLSSQTETTIPALQVSTADGEKLLRYSVGKTLTIEKKMGYGYLSGTSMAAPHVTGVIAKIWRICPTCTNQEVESCILNSTIDLGDPGKDDFYGRGLVQALPAFLCLKNTAQCCNSSYWW